MKRNQKQALEAELKFVSEDPRRLCERLVIGGKECECVMVAGGDEVVVLGEGMFTKAKML